MASKPVSDHAGEVALDCACCGANMAQRLPFGPD
jgi:hypothetical protein